MAKKITYFDEFADFDMSDYGRIKKILLARESTRVSQDKDAQLPYPHYTDERWNKAQLVFGSECKTQECSYSDRLYEWDYKAADKADDACKGMDRTVARIEKWLEVYHGKPVNVRCVYAGVNRSSGYPYYVYGYDYK